jgi:hypothetical protein
MVRRNFNGSGYPGKGAEDLPVPIRERNIDFNWERGGKGMDHYQSLMALI